MNTSILKAQLTSERNISEIPCTPRGRALYTIDWFLNGKPVLRNHDNPQLRVKSSCLC